MRLRFLKDAKPIPLTEDFWYMITDGGWCKPEDFLDPEEAQRVRDAINLIKQYEEQGIDEGYFEEI